MSLQPTLGRRRTPAGAAGLFDSAHKTAQKLKNSSSLEVPAMVTFDLVMKRVFAVLSQHGPG